MHCWSHCLRHNNIYRKRIDNGNLKPFLLVDAGRVRAHHHRAFRKSQFTKKNHENKTKGKCVICQQAKRIAFIFIIHSASTKDVTLKTMQQIHIYSVSSCVLRESASAREREKYIASFVRCGTFERNKTISRIKFFGIFFFVFVSWNRFCVYLISSDFSSKAIKRTKQNE